jgi:PAS domain S-box-containing protein
MMEWTQPNTKQGLTGLAYGAALPRLAATVTILVALVAIAGWVFDLPQLASVIPGVVAMKANTAVALVLCGISLLLLADASTVRVEGCGQGIALAVAGIGLASLAEYVLGRPLGLDEFLFRDTHDAYNVFRGRMSPFTAAVFIDAGFALVARRHELLKRAANIAAALIILVGMTVLVGYLWNAGELVTDSLLPPVAINTAGCFVVLGTGILLAPLRRAASDPPALAGLASVEISVLAGFFLAMVLLLIAGTYTYRTSVQLADSVAWVTHTQQVRTVIADLKSSLAAAELAQRDYLLNPQQGRMDEHLRLIAEVGARLAELEKLTPDNAEQRKNLQDLKSGVARRLDDASVGLTAYQHFGIEAARAVLRDRRRGHSFTENVGIITDKMDAIEARLLAQRQQAFSHVERTTLVSLLITLALAGALFIALFRSIHREMLARRDAEGALRASEQYNRSIVASSPDCLAILNMEGRIAQMTPHGLRLMDISHFASIENTHWLDLWSGGDLTKARDAVEDARHGSAGRFQGYCPTRSGTPKWWDVIVMPIRGAAGNAESLLAVARDITEVKRGERELLEANAFLDSLVENLPVMVFVKDARTLRYVRQNRATLDLLGIGREDMLGKFDRDFLPPEEAAFILAKDREVLAGGHLVDVPEQSIHSRTLGTRTLHTKKMPILDEYGEPKYLLGISVDITERKRADQAIRELNAELRENAARLQASNKELESFSYSVSHDLRAPLRAIDGFALMMQEDYGPRLDAEGIRYLSVIRENSRRMGELIDDLLAFSRLGRQPVSSDQVNVDSLVREVVDEILQGGSSADPAEVKAAPIFEVQPLPPTQGDRGLLRQVWVNLIANAVKYSSKVAQPVVQISGCEVNGERHYSVRDNGVGFSMEYVEKLFGVFQRLHRADEFSGTGVGLAIVQRVIARHGGRVWAEGEVNKGAVFSFALPKEANRG